MCLGVWIREWSSSLKTILVGQNQKGPICAVQSHRDSHQVMLRARRGRKHMGQRCFRGPTNSVPWLDEGYTDGLRLIKLPTLDMRTFLCLCYTLVSSFINYFCNDRLFYHTRSKSVIVINLTKMIRPVWDLSWRGRGLPTARCFSWRRGVAVLLAQRAVKG